MDAAWNPLVVFLIGALVGLTLREVGGLIFWALVLLGLSAASAALTAHRRFRGLLMNRSRS